LVQIEIVNIQLKGVDIISISIWPAQKPMECLWFSKLKGSEMRYLSPVHHQYKYPLINKISKANRKKAGLSIKVIALRALLKQLTIYMDVRQYWSCIE